MATPQEQRHTRLGNDHREMQNIQGSLIRWHALRGTPPYVEAYELTVNVRTIINPGRAAPEYRDKHVITVSLPPNYPYGAPQVRMQTSPPPYHPNWFSDGGWCFGTWIIAEGLGYHVLRMVRTLQFHPEITNPSHPANRAARDWYNANGSRGWFPCDRQVLPDPTHARFEVLHEKKTFRLE